MEGQVTHILGIAPYDGMQTAMERVAEEFPNIQLDAYTGDLEAGAAIVRSVQLENYDVIISRGGTADRIREVTDLPVVSIQLSVYDVLRAIKMAENYSNLYAIVGFPSITEPAHTLCDLLRLDMDIITIHSMDETNRALDRLREGGYKMVVSDMVTHTLARQKGFDAFLITSGVESLHDAFAQAVQISDRFASCGGKTSFWRASPAPAAATPSFWTRTASWSTPPGSPLPPSCWNCCGPRSPTSRRRLPCAFSTAKGASSPA